MLHDARILVKTPLGLTAATVPFVSIVEREADDEEVCSLWGMHRSFLVRVRVGPHGLEGTGRAPRTGGYG